jgi:predicted nuclease of predicted toxin-antitoxin system
VLEDLGLDTDTVVSERLAGSPDTNILQAAFLTDRILFTLDTGFLDLKKYPPGSHKGIVVFRPPTQVH